MNVKSLSVSAAFVIAVLGAAVPVCAAQIILTPSSVVGDTGSYTFGSAGTTHPGGQPAGRIFDQQTGPIATEAYTVGYWVNGDNGPVT
ncbi:hypothetical protein SPAN111604_15120 [Sphingomonas antarctica]|uniref:hypothetical protein n=1 Tax=Sphingomonas antarctica TaxID=2040274 RepID=UPI0039EAA8F2